MFDGIKRFGVGMREVFGIKLPSRDYILTGENCEKLI